MSFVSGFRCVECSAMHSIADVEYICPTCGGNLDVLYDYERIAGALSQRTLSDNRDLTMWRYRALLPIRETSTVPSLAVGFTPIYDCRRLKAELGIRGVLVKDEGRNPTGSLKDRPSALAVVKAQESRAKVITTASSGNAGVALAGICANTGARALIFVPATCPPAKIAQLQIYGATVVLVEGTYDEAYELCVKAAQQHGWYQRSTGYNPFMTEGKKTAALEIAEQLQWELPDRVFVAVGDGCIIGGLWKGFTDLRKLGFIERLPQMIGVQAEGSAPIVDAVNGDGVVRPVRARTIADSISVGQPRDATKAIRAIRESGGSGIKVSDDEIIEAVRRLAGAEGVFGEPSAVASFAGLMKMCESGAIRHDERVLLVLTGNGLKDVAAATRSMAPPLQVGPNLEALEELLHGPLLSLRL